MSLGEIVFIGIGLAMDAAAVSMTNGMVYKNLKAATYVAMPLSFGVFQALMPILGYYISGIFADIITRYSGIVILLILGIIGGKMVKEGIDDIRGKDGDEEYRTMTIGVLFFQAIATSIDAFAMGIAFNAAGMGIMMPSMIIGVVTALIVIAAIIIGRKFGNMLGSRAEIVGGLILIIIGIKAII